MLPPAPKKVKGKLAIPYPAGRGSPKKRDPMSWNGWVVYTDINKECWRVVNNKFMALRASPPAHPETAPRRSEVIREVQGQRGGHPNRSTEEGEGEKKEDGWMREVGEG